MRVTNVPSKVLNNMVHFLAPYEQAVEELKLKLKGIKYGFQKSGRYSPIEFVVGRVKKVDSLVKKANEKGIDFLGDHWQSDVAREVQDIAGLRVVCRYVDDVREVLQLLQEREDIVIHDVKDYIAAPKESGYRSIHMIVSYTVYHGSEKRTLFCEIQIRTLGMNFWATNEHELRYKYAGNIPTDVLQQLHEASVITHQLDVLMNNLRQEILTPAEVDTTLEEKLEEIFSLYVKQDLDSAAALYREHVSGFEEAFADNPKFKMIHDLLGIRLK
ncbi:MULTISPECIES: GTP pyrophosphokinase family protein [Brevibacillus]|uniref:GTP pyrophosphokinase n=1 Tax=Brevibacillus TaxID=55080 RepID=UPI0007D89FF7|nr:MULTISPECIES: GTP pyrophosphokinase family protein [Bacillales]OUQ85733.1 GTP pyrophosphokinase [Brevibacillus brevis]TQR36890.1 GTP pyrophosphokinase family protein [Lysinibacillus sp. SDF0063]UIO40051.1 GTP pyrophosphokinase family protein [Brevibacillus brevis]WGV57461.1 GTP pyrophosphokinase family protein [Brevibacillus brevis]WJQ78980.1 GTP pyrophosphokinase family protein [Brevibacillus brevis]